MASLVLKMSVSLDGFVAPRDGGDEDWAAAGRSDDGATWVAATVGGARVQLVGATTCATWARYWPGAPGPVAAAMNDVPRVVFSTSLASADWPGTTIARGDLAGVVGRLKSEHGEGYLLAQGGVRFARSLVAAGLVDEYRLVVHPVVLGAGEPLFTAPLALDPVETVPFSRGAVAHVLRPSVAAPRVAPSGPSGTGTTS
jgi:dihydrofolate reductase